MTLNFNELKKINELYELMSDEQLEVIVKSEPTPQSFLFHDKESILLKLQNQGAPLELPHYFIYNYTSRGEKTEKLSNDKHLTQLMQRDLEITLITGEQKKFFPHGSDFIVSEEKACNTIKNERGCSLDGRNYVPYRLNKEDAKIITVNGKWRPPSYILKWINDPPPKGTQLLLHLSFCPSLDDELKHFSDTSMLSPMAKLVHSKSDLERDVQDWSNCLVRYSISSKFQSTSDSLLIPLKTTNGELTTLSHFKKALVKRNPELRIPLSGAKENNYYFIFRENLCSNLLKNNEQLSLIWKLIKFEFITKNQKLFNSQNKKSISNVQELEKLKEAGEPEELLSSLGGEIDETEDYQSDGRDYRRLKEIIKLQKRRKDLRR